MLAVTRAAAVGAAWFRQAPGSPLDAGQRCGKRTGIRVHVPWRNQQQRQKPGVPGREL